MANSTTAAEEAAELGRSLSPPTSLPPPRHLPSTTLQDAEAHKAQAEVDAINAQAELDAAAKLIAEADENAIAASAAESAARDRQVAAAKALSEAGTEAEREAAAAEVLEVKEGWRDNCQSRLPGLLRCGDLIPPRVPFS